MTTIILKSGKADSALRLHPWIFSGAIKKIKGPVEEGDIVRVTSNKDEFLGLGHYQNGSIAVRIISFEEVEIDEKFWFDKIKNAYEHRKSIGLISNPNTNVYRLVFAEGDGIPGLVIDYYNGAAVIQPHSIGMHYLRNEIASSLKTIYGDRLHTIYYKCEDSLPKNVNFLKENEFLLGNMEETEVLENGNAFMVNWVEGQKTGFFIDQRFNRELVGLYSKGRNVLNTYCYTGGFSIYALNKGANLVHSVDSSKRAIELTEANVALTSHADKHESFAVDAIEYLKSFESKYDLIILDPPAFAKHKDVRHRAIQGYKRINMTAIQKIAPKGILFTFSCSQVIDARTFESTVLSAAILAKRKVKVLHHLSQPADHPYSIFHLEGKYLKGLVLYIE